ncbi:hypothetical protein D9Q98_009072 [Chlorella vulgaris]|uniref:Peptidase C1A papain C-terminal domain-containing protein n=1 Tax=Chlorella vulgaris TaxID=3077 RepID=A0A9D4TH49_CHLVU|nr:hypothetical protein D9Q98_009072 [Chlorella vulgaris]
MLRLQLTAAAVLLLLLTTAPAAEAGCRKTRKVVPREEMFFNHQLAPQNSLESLPKSWNWNDIDGRSMLTPSWNQHIPKYCGSCWLHGTTSMIQDRLKIVKGGIGPDTMLARQVVLNCGAFHGYGKGCDGGDVIDVVRYMKHYGLPDESCQPYSATDHTVYGKGAERCPADGYCTNCMPLKGVDTCWPVRSPIRYYLSAYGKLEEPGELGMMNELFHRGPITCSMATVEVFDYGYHRGVARDTTNATEVDHDVEVVGWGEEDGLKYWLIRNSWGTYWGDMGFFKAERGVNAFQLEAGDCWYAVPTWKDEQDVRSGAKLGTMWGIFSKEEADQIIPEGHRHPHYKKKEGPGTTGAATGTASGTAVEAGDVEAWEFEDTPEDRLEGRPGGQEAAEQQTGAAGEGRWQGAAAKGGARQASLRAHQPLGGRRQQA